MRNILITSLILHCSLCAAQCISNFPHTQDFEATNGNWVSGGTASDWAWGAVSKTVIAQAASGSNCWVTGGLTASFYNLGESSYLQSPCFNLSTLINPVISFDVYWETEKGYDGATFQSSVDGGTTWQNVGSSSDIDDCITQNWFNASGINYLNGLANPREGWAGNVQSTSGSCQGGNGSNGWKKAQHCIKNLAGQPNVIFRFAFGAGTQCNNYDGFAIDDFIIEEAPLFLIDYTYTCNGNSFDFTSTYNLCPTVFNWNFGDGATATGSSVSHTYTNPGNYDVTFVVSGNCFTPVTIVKQIQTVQIITGSTSETCNGANNGKAFVTSTGSSAFTYQWNTSPMQTTDTAFNLAAGSYAVTVTAINNCSASASVVVGSHGISLAMERTNVSCYGKGDGEITATVSGGTAPYNILWSTGDTATYLTKLSEGNYIVTVSDAANCTVSDSVVIEKATCPSYVYLPTAFSPNGDGVNDFFRGKASPDLKSFAVHVYNRWGEMIFESVDITEGWDGVYKGIAQPISTYVWYAEYSFTNGEKHSQAGNVTLVR